MMGLRQLLASPPIFMTVWEKKLLETTVLLYSQSSLWIESVFETRLLAKIYL